MATEFPSNLSTTIQSLYNDPGCSDIVVVFNSESYHLMSKFVKIAAPGLYDEIDKITVTEPSVPIFSPEMTADVALTKFTEILTKKTQKKTLTISEPSVSKDVVGAVFESMYGKPLEVSTVNLNEMYILGIKFGMQSLIQKCTDIIKKLSSTDVLLDSYQKAVVAKSPLLSHYQNAFMSMMTLFLKEKIFGITRQLDYAALIEFLKSDKLTCSEDYVYEIIEDWVRGNNIGLTQTQTKELYSLVKLELLSVDFLMTRVKGHIHTYVDHDAYVKAFEESAMRFIRDKQPCTTRTVIMLFAFGKHEGLYQGYRQVTKEDVNNPTFKQALQKQYVKYNGLHCLDSLSPADVVCCATGEPIAILDNSWLRFLNKSLEKDHIVLSNTSQCDVKNVKESIGTVHVSQQMHKKEADDVGLFVITQAVF